MDKTRPLPIECGKDAAKEFRFADGYVNLNHGSFGTYPTCLKPILRHYQDASEVQTDKFIRHDYPRLLDRSREAIANYLNAPTEACVFISNATTGLNTVLRALVYEPGDVIVYFSTIYGACEKTVEYLTETTPVTSLKITNFTYPDPSSSDENLSKLFGNAISSIKAEGKKPKLAIFDTISSLPGVRVPFERLTEICRENGVLSCIDGAHGVGHIPLDMIKLDPDFFFSNCHKWLHVPRGCAVLYIPVRNQHLVRSTLPTSHGFTPLPQPGKADIHNVMAVAGKSAFVANFEFVGTIDNSPYLCIPAAIEWRKRLTWQGKSGEEAVMSYSHDVAARGGALMASLLGTSTMISAESGTNFSNVLVPLDYATVTGKEEFEFATAVKVAKWMSDEIMHLHNTFLAFYIHGEKWWVRVSSQVYLTLGDYEYGARVLNEMCDRVRRGEWRDIV
ncbi:PLP-dependent transferase [Teratosphaeria nubilosa]|uniref:PLP-dependent transferase n=1 Tax=Teratosphaeria nubilosa TaxID=161662 RepID=A0A6G1KTQ1_9PEZI|nr:PLP-dependent transferase [Teratosphaeria nubilosa]